MIVFCVSENVEKLFSSHTNFIIWFLLFVYLVKEIVLIDEMRIVKSVSDAIFWLFITFLGALNSFDVSRVSSVSSLRQNFKLQEIWNVDRLLKLCFVLRPTRFSFKTSSSGTFGSYICTLSIWFRLKIIKQYCLMAYYILPRCYIIIAVVIGHFLFFFILRSIIQLSNTSSILLQ